MASSRGSNARTALRRPRAHALGHEIDIHSIQRQFSAALDALVAEIKKDRSVIAAILCGSLSHDTVWTRSDIDLVLVTIDDKKVALSDLALYADGLNVHAILIPRAEFRKAVESSTQHSFMHSFLAKGRVLYSHDPTVGDLCGRLHSIGARDAAVQLLRAGTRALPPIDKAHKWLVTRGDLEYTALWLLYAAMPLAEIEMIQAGRLVDREVIPKAIELNPVLFKAVYTDLLNERKTRPRVEAALAAADRYLADRAPALFAPVIEYLQEAGEIRSSKEIEDHFKRSFDVSGVTTACEYLAHQELIGKASTPVHLTQRSQIELQELAFYFRAEHD